MVDIVDWPTPSGERPTGGYAGIATLR
jgi:hypothetical protein